jgi:hypothetical protein
MGWQTSIQRSELLSYTNLVALDSLSPSSTMILPMRLQITSATEGGNGISYLTSCMLNQSHVPYECIGMQSPYSLILPHTVAATCSNLSVLTQQFCYWTIPWLTKIASKYGEPTSACRAVLVDAICNHIGGATCPACSHLLIFRKLEKPRTAKYRPQESSRNFTTVFDNNPC